MAADIAIGRKRRKSYSHLGQVSFLFLYISFSRLQIHLLDWQKVESVVSILIIQYSKSSTWVIRSRDFKQWLNHVIFDFHFERFLQQKHCGQPYNNILDGLIESYVKFISIGERESARHWPTVKVV